VVKASSLVLSEKHDEAQAISLSAAWKLSEKQRTTYPGKPSGLQKED